MTRTRVLEVSSPVTAIAGRHLADSGADVIKVEAPATEVSSDGYERARRLYCDTDKRSLTLAIERQEGRDLFRRLVERVDIVLESGPPGQLAAWGLGYDVLSGLNPRVTLVSISPFGQTGPYAGYVGDDLVAFAMGGLMYISGESNGAPVVAPCEQAYAVAGIHAALGALAGKRAAGRFGHGEWVDVAMVECLAAQENTITNYRGENEFSRRSGSQHRSSLPGRIFKSKDGYIHIFVNQSGNIWERFIQWLGSPPELASPDLAEINERWRHSDLVNAVTERFTASRTMEELFVSGQRHHLPVAPVYSIAEALSDAQIRFIGTLDDVAGAGPGQDGSYVTLRPPIHRGRPQTTRSHAPTVGRDTDVVLAELLSLSVEERADLRRAGVV